MLNFSWTCLFFYGCNAIFTCIDQLSKYCRLIPGFVRDGALGASSVTKLFFENVPRFFGILAEMISDRDPKFTATFW